MHSYMMAPPFILGQNYQSPADWMWGGNHRPNNYKDTNPKCRLYWCLIEFTDWRYIQSVMLVNFVKYFPSIFSLVHLPRLPCVNKYRYIQSIQCVTGGGYRGWGCVKSIYRRYTVCIWPDSEPTKLLYHPQTSHCRVIACWSSSGSYEHRWRVTSSTAWLCT